MSERDWGLDIGRYMGGDDYPDDDEPEESATLLRCQDCGAPMLSTEFDPAQPYCPACWSGE